MVTGSKSWKKIGVADSLPAENPCISLGTGEDDLDTVMCVASSGRISSRGDFTFDIPPTMAGMDFRVFLRSEVPLTASWLHLYPVGVELHRLINNTNEGGCDAE